MLEHRFGETQTTNLGNSGPNHQPITSQHVNDRIQSKTKEEEKACEESSRVGDVFGIHRPGHRTAMRARGGKSGIIFIESNLEIQNLVLSLTPVPILEMNIVV